MQNKPTLDVVNKPPPQYDLMSTTQLVHLWQSDRNGMTGVLAANEVVRRLASVGVLYINRETLNARPE